MKKIFITIFIALFLVTATTVLPVYADSIAVRVEDDKKKDDKKKDPPGPVVVKDKKPSEGKDGDRKKGKKPE